MRRVMEVERSLLSGWTETISEVQVNLPPSQQMELEPIAAFLNKIHNAVVVDGFQEVVVVVTDDDPGRDDRARLYARMRYMQELMPEADSFLVDVSDIEYSHELHAEVVESFTNAYRIEIQRDGYKAIWQLKFTHKFPFGSPERDGHPDEDESAGSGGTGTKGYSEASGVWD